MSKAVHKKQREVLASARTGKYSVSEVTPIIKGIHLLPRGSGKWAVTTLGRNRVLRVFAHKASALAWAKLEASTQNSRIFVHGRDGKVERAAV